MQILGCDGALSIDASGSPVCSGNFVAVTPSELAASANNLSASDFSVIAGYVVLWFSLAFGVKMIRRVFNL